jgi:hypothetical protein
MIDDSVGVTNNSRITNQRKDENDYGRGNIRQKEKDVS